MENCSYLNFYKVPLTTWLYVKNPSAPGYFGPFIVSGQTPHDPTLGVAHTFYEVVIPGFSRQQCYQVYAISNASWFAFDPTNSWGFVPPPGLDPTFYPNQWMTPLGVPARIVSTFYPITACLCEGSDTIAACNSNFKFTLGRYTSNPGMMLVGLSSLVTLNEFHPLSTYLIDWGLGPVPFSGLSSSMPYISPSGSYTVCIIEITTDRDTCKTCMDFCIPEPYQQHTARSNSGMMRKLAKTNNIKSIGEIDMSPNPANMLTELKFNLPQKEIVTVSVIDLSGKLVVSFPAREMDKGAQTVVISTADLASGMYQVQISIGQNTTMRKLSVVK